MTDLSRFHAHYGGHDGCPGLSCHVFQAELLPPVEEMTAEERRRQREERRTRMAASFGIGRHYATARLEDFPEYVRIHAELQGIDDDAEHDDAFSRAYTAAGIWTWSSPEDGPGWLITGPTGVGKTHLACALVREFDHCGQARFVTTADLLDAVKRSWDSSIGAGGLVRAVGDARVLVLDDLGAERVTEWSTGELVRFFDGWCSRDASIVVTSNLDLVGIGERYGARLMSRLAELTRPYVMTGPDRRLHRRPRVVREG